MIDVSLIDTHGFAKVPHDLSNDWDWDKISRCVLEIVGDDKRRYHSLGNGGFACWGMERYFKEVLDFLQKAKPEYQPRAALYASTDATSKSFELHRDPNQYIWIWQVIGDTPWQVEDQEFILHESEMLYIDNELLHCAKPNSPRASFTFSLEKEHFYG